jgi:hypothetical protein
MKHLALFSAITLLSLPVIAEEPTRKHGFWLGGGAAATVAESDCYGCDTTGHVFELGYDFNQVVGLEFKMGETSASGDEIDFDYRFFGVNIGGDFGTGWVKLYGKAGLMEIEATHEESYYDYWSSYESYFKVSDENPAFGIGVRFTPGGEQKGFYIKLESMFSQFDDYTYEVGFVAIGVKF